jgi:hypothetical protein
LTHVLNLIRSVDIAHAIPKCDVCIKWHPRWRYMYTYFLQLQWWIIFNQYKHFPCWYSYSYINTSGNWENEVFFYKMSSFPNLHECYMTYNCLLYSREWDTEKYTVRYFPYLYWWRYRSRDNLLLGVKFHNFLLGNI